jgi:tetratricopeptide (TPR) repeat protein
MSASSPNSSSPNSRQRSTNSDSQIVMITVVLLLLMLSIYRNSIWQTPISLWQDVAKKNINKARVHNNLGNSFALAGRTLEAITEYKTALALDRYYMEAYYNLGTYLEDMGRADEAMAYYSIYCKGAPFSFRKTAACDRYNILSHK